MNASQTEPAVSASPMTPDAHAATQGPSDQEAARLIRQFSGGNLAGLRLLLARTREACAWQERIQMLDLVAVAIPLDVLETACAIEPDAADLAVVRCAYYSAQTLAHHDEGFAEVTAANVRKAGESIRAAMTSLEAAARLDPADPTPFACIMSALGIFPQLQPVRQHAFHQATALAPELTAYLDARQNAPVSPTRPN